MKVCRNDAVAMDGTRKIHFRRMVLTVIFLLSLQYVYITVNKLHLKLYYLFHFKKTPGILGPRRTVLHCVCGYIIFGQSVFVADAWYNNESLMASSDVDL
jgi:hypothetical protein